VATYREVEIFNREFLTSIENVLVYQSQHVLLFLEINQWAKSFLTIWHCILSAELAKNALFQTAFLAIFHTGSVVLTALGTELKLAVDIESSSNACLTFRLCQPWHSIEARDLIFIKIWWQIYETLPFIFRIFCLEDLLLGTISTPNLKFLVYKPLSYERMTPQPMMRNLKSSMNIWERPSMISPLCR